jgi:hypothetical protein
MATSLLFSWSGAIRDSSAAGEAVEQPLQRGDNRFFVQAVEHLAAMLAHTHQARTAQDVQVVRNGRAAERDPLGNLANDDRPLSSEPLAYFVAFGVWSTFASEVRPCSF